MYFKYELGLTAKDKVTDFHGIISERIECLFGNNKYKLSPKVNKEGELKCGQIFEEGRIEILDEGFADDIELLEVYEDNITDKK